MYNYTYDNGRIEQATESDITFNDYNFIASKTVISKVSYYYDGEGTLTKKRITTPNGEQVITYNTAENKSQLVKTVVGEHSFLSSSKNDSFGRKEFDELRLDSGFVYRKFEYLDGAVTEEHSEKDMLKSTPTTQLVSKIELSDGRTIAYEYDAEERITKVTDSVDGTTEYTYDALGQLVSEVKGEETVNQMTYDNYGNILSKNGIAYIYDTVWKDKLISYNGQAIAYDKQGNPTTYLGNTLTWEKGRQLKSFGSNTYTYNANGIRNSKTVDGIRHDFYLDGGKILKETWGNNTLETVFDNEESVCGIIYNGTPYYFLKNLQGDIIAITDNSGNVVARYSYDAWGVCTIAQDTSGCNIATTNPFRYRGYYFDSETELYYLQSRYYDAEVGRFINGDDVEIVTIPEQILQTNLFAYCGNDPINENDIYGNAIGSILSKLFFGILMGFVKQIVADLIDLAYECIILNRAVFLKLSPINDYLGSILSEIAAQFTVNIKKRKATLNLIIGGAALIIKYIPKILNKKMNNREWLKLIGDIIALALSYVIEQLSNNVNKKLKYVKKGLNKHPRDLRLNAKNKALNLKIKKMGIAVSLYIPISQQILSLIAISIFR